MANQNFPGPRFNQIIEKDKQIISVPLDNVDWGARPVSTQTPIKNDQVIKHIKNGNGE